MSTFDKLDFTENVIKKFINILLQFSQDDRLLDINRCLLSQDPLFDTSSLYNYILYNFSEPQYKTQNVITFDTFKKFLQIGLNISTTDEILSKFFDFYTFKINSENTERFFIYIDFVKIFYPRYNMKLQKIMIQRTTLNNYIREINYNTKILLKKLFLCEMNLINNLLNGLKNDVKNWFYNKKAFFDLLFSNKKIITKQDLVNFFNLYYKELYFTEEDINAICCRFSLNNNFNEGISKNSFMNIFDCRKFNDQKLSYEETYNKKLNILKSIIPKITRLEKLVNELKIFLTSRPDFSFKTLISLFFSENNNINNNINTNDIKFYYNNFKIFLSKINFYVKTELELQLIFRRIDFKQSGYITPEDIYRFFIPYGRIYKDAILKNNLFEDNEKNNIEFSKGTIEILNNIFNVLMNGEKEINVMKIDLCDEIVYINHIFDDILRIKCDKNNNDYREDNGEDVYDDYVSELNCVSYEQFYIFVKEVIKANITDEEFKLLFHRIDINCNGKMEFFEFVNECKYIK